MRLSKTGRLLVWAYIITGIFILGTVSMVYFVITPNRIVSSYNHRVSTGAQALRKTYSELEGTLQLSIFNTPDNTPAQNLKDLKIIDDTIRKTRKSIDAYQDHVSTIAEARYTSFSSIYNVAHTASDDVKYMVAQSTQVIDAYDELASFLRVANETQLVIEKQLDDINAIHDFNELAGRHGEIYARAETTKDAGRLLKDTSAPQEYAQAKSALLAHLNTLATDLDRLAYGLLVAVDSTIYGAVGSIEDTTVRYFERDRHLLYDAAQDSPTLHNVAEISDKLFILEERDHH